MYGFIKLCVFRIRTSAALGTFNNCTFGSFFFLAANKLGVSWMVALPLEFNRHEGLQIQGPRRQWLNVDDQTKFER